MQIEFNNGESYDILSRNIQKMLPIPRIQARNNKTTSIATIEEMNFSDENSLLKQFKCIEIMKCIDHENILSSFSTHFKNKKYYFVTENLLCDLHETIYSSCPLEAIDFRLIIYQVLQGLLALHSAGIVHNHIFSESIWINEECDIKLSDFYFATEINNEYNDIIVDLQNCAPEIICKSKNITGKADIWSCGCVLYELVTRKPIFSIDFPFNALKQIIKKIGMPNGDDLYFVDDNILTSLLNLQVSPKQSIIENDDKLLIDLLSKMLVFNPNKRWDAEKCLQHPYFKEILEYFPTQPNYSYKSFDWSAFNNKNPREEILALINP